MVDALGMLTAGDRAGGVDHPIDRTQSPADHDPRRERADHEHDQAGDQEDDEESRHGRVGLAEGGGQDSVVTVAQSLGQDAVVGVAVDRRPGHDAFEDLVELGARDLGQRREGVGIVGISGATKRDRLAIRRVHQVCRGAVLVFTLGGRGRGGGVGPPPGNGGQFVVDLVRQRSPRRGDHHPPQGRRRDDEHRHHRDGQPSLDGHDAASGSCTE